MFRSNTHSAIRITVLFTLLSWMSVLTAAPIVGPGVGQTAPDFTLPDMKKKPQQLSKLLQKGHVLLIFWSTRCPVCRKLTPEFKAIQTKYKDKGLTVVAVNVGNENHDEIDDYVFQHALNYMVLNDDDKKAYVARQYRLIGTPTLKLVAPDGKILWHGHGLPDLSTWFK